MACSDTQGSGPRTGEGDLLDLLLILAKGEELEPIAGLAPAYSGALW